MASNYPESVDASMIEDFYGDGLDDDEDEEEEEEEDEENSDDE